MNTTESLHQAVAKREGIRLEEGQEIDHRDGDGLNCRRGNLRAATSTQNHCNTPVRKRNKSGVKGVCFQKGAWCAYITSKGKTRNLGRYRSKEDAAHAYAHAAVQIHGEFARLA